MLGPVVPGRHEVERIAALARQLGDAIDAVTAVPPEASALDDSRMPDTHL